MSTKYDRREAADEITRLRAELAEARRDAERYRWLRISRPLTLSLCLDTATTVDAALDAAIDAAIAAEKLSGVQSDAATEESEDDDDESEDDSSVRGEAR